MKSKLSWREKIFVLCAGILFLGGWGVAQEAQSNGADITPKEFEQVISLDWSLNRLATAVSAGDVEQIPKDKYLLIEGVVSSREVVQAEEENYFAILEVSSGEWSGNQNLSMYHCYFRLEGSEFHGLVPAGRGGQSENEIPLHAHVLAIGRYMGYGEDQQGNRYPVLRALRIKKLRQ